MSWTSARTDIYTRWLANSPVPAGRNDTSMFNGTVYSPTPDPEAAPADQTWMRLQVDTTPTTGQRLGIGNALRYREGTILASFFFLAETGEDELGIMDTFLEAFDQECFGIVTTLEPDEPDKVPSPPDESWAQYNATIPFYAIEAPGSDLSLSDNILIQSTPAAHGFVAGDFVALNDSNDTWEKGIADSDSHNYSLGGFVYFVSNPNDFMVALGGVVRITGHGKGTGELYTSQSTAGSVSTTAPTAGVRYHPGVGVDANRIAVLPTVKDVNPRQL